ncbi:MAG: tetratricopeptide repeat protein [Thermoanaerobaculia bacterium]|nr:tetratricopeptide repeat protein [Thermoanaerobaculia bacterium]
MTLQPAHLVVIALLSLGADFAAPARGTSLPPPKCVELLRGARIAQMRGDRAVELEKLRLAAESFPAELAPLYALLDYHRRHPLSDAEHHGILELVSQRLEDREHPLPAAFLDFLVSDPETDPATLGLTLDHLAERTAAGEPADPDLLAVRASLEERLGRAAEATQTLERLWQQTERGDVLWRLFMLHLRLEHWPEALRCADRMSGDDWRVPPGMLLDLVSKAGEVERTLEQVEKMARAADPTSPLPYSQVDSSSLAEALKRAAWNLRDREQDEGAEKVFRRALALQPQDAEIHGALLYLYGSEQERQEHAEAVADTWAKETDSRKLFDEGTRRLTTGDAAAAVDLLRRAAPGLSDLEAAWYNLGMAAYRLEDWDTTASAFDRAAQLNPTRGQSHFFLGIALGHLDRCAEAIPALQHALELGHEAKLVHYYLYDCYKKLGDLAGAKVEYERYKAGG